LGAADRKAGDAAVQVLLRAMALPAEARAAAGLVSRRSDQPTAARCIVSHFETAARD
jgi:hypothetical protein